MSSTRAARWPADGPVALRVFRFLLGLLLVPASVGLLRALWRAATLESERPTVLSLDTGVFVFLAGMGAFCLAYVFLPRPTRAYVLAHELTHAIFALLHGARVRDVRVRDDRGSVRISHSHTLTLLAPYFFPLYTVVTIGLVTLAGLVWPSRAVEVTGMALIGISWGFHFCFTVNSLLQHQTDIERCGYVFSYALILFLNLLVLAVGLVAATPLTARAFARLWRADTGRAFGALSDTLIFLHDRAWGWFS